MRSVDMYDPVTPLFVPANRCDRFQKADASAADAIILDLEDSVSETDKTEARRYIKADFTLKPVFVRVNAVGSPWHMLDVAAVENMGVVGVMIPKAEFTADFIAVCTRLKGFHIIALIETARGVSEARVIAAVSGVRQLAFGSLDFAADIGCDHTREALLLARGEIVLASRLARKPAPLDGVTMDIASPSRAEDDARYAKSLGFGGKLCIHPAQIDEATAAFVPSGDEMAWAQKVLQGGGGVQNVDGLMVDEPVRLRARAIMARGSLRAVLSKPL